MIGLFHKLADDLAIGDRHVSTARTITPRDIAAWCELTGDRHKLHTDPNFAAASRFGAIIAPGYMVLAFSVGATIPPDTATVVANYGAEAVRFTRAVYPGDAITTTATVRDVDFKREELAVASLDWRVANQHDETVVSATLKLAYARRSASA